jgi:hypothetical protein
MNWLLTRIDDDRIQTVLGILDHDAAINRLTDDGMERQHAEQALADSIKNCMEVGSEDGEHILLPIIDTMPLAKETDNTADEFARWHERKDGGNWS